MECLYSSICFYKMFTMQTNEILNAPLIDIIFDGRNKDYGAYELRKNYSGRIGRAMLVMSIVVSLAFGGVIMGNNFKKHGNGYIIQPGASLTDIKEDKAKIIEPQKPKKPEPEVKTVKSTTIEIVNKPDVDPPPTNDEIKNAIVGIETKGGIEDTGYHKPPAEDPDGGKGIINIPKKAEGPVETVDVEAKFNGNWKGFLERNLDPEIPVEHGAPAGTYSVIIQFVVDLDGSMSEVKALTEQGYGMEQEALRVIRKAGKWDPGIYHGFAVKSYRKQVITFQVMEE
jgi:protein TonB